MGKLLSNSESEIWNSRKRKKTMTGNRSLIKSHLDIPHPTPSSLSTKPIDANSRTHMIIWKKKQTNK